MFVVEWWIKILTPTHCNLCDMFDHCSILFPTGLISCVNILEVPISVVRERRLEESPEPSEFITFDAHVAVK